MQYIDLNPTFCTSKTVINKSEECFSNDFDCYPYTDVERYSAFTWCIVNIVFGSLGNLLTILALSNVYNKKLYDTFKINGCLQIIQINQFTFQLQIQIVYFDICLELSCM